MDTKKLALEYVLGVSKDNGSSIQSIANIKYFKAMTFEECNRILSLPVEDFCKMFSSDITRDYVYKNDFLTPRNVYLINPLYYLFYTYLTFKIMDEHLDINSRLELSKGNVNVYYAGLYSKENIMFRIFNKYNYYNSYNRFQEKREEYIGRAALKLDIKDFFGSIRLNKLFEKLRKYSKSEESKKTIKDLEYLLRNCGFEVLPQINYSIASSILSQIYLRDFDIRLTKHMPENLVCIRYVDDMYFVNTLKEDEKEFNIWINLITDFLWQDGLNLNTFKTKILTEEEYQRHIITQKNPYGKPASLYIELIDNKTNEVTSSSGFSKMILELSGIEKEFGIDMKKYGEVIENYLSIDGDYTNKVLKNIIYSGKWKEMDEYQLESIIRDWKVILFNPLHFTVLFILIHKHLNKTNEENPNPIIKDVVDYLVDTNLLTFRDLILSVTYLLQINFTNNELLKKINEIDKNFVAFIEKFILKKL